MKIKIPLTPIKICRRGVSDEVPALNMAPNLLLWKCARQETCEEQKEKADLTEVCLFFRSGSLSERKRLSH